MDEEDLSIVWQAVVMGAAYSDALAQIDSGPKRDDREKLERAIRIVAKWRGGE